jgi:hypothetical protein
LQISDIGGIEMKSYAIGIVGMMLMIGLMGAMPVMAEEGESSATQSNGPVIIVELVPDMGSTNLYTYVPGGPEINVDIGYLTVTIYDEKAMSKPINASIIAALPDNLILNLPESRIVHLDWETQIIYKVSTVETGDVIGQLVRGHIKIMTSSGIQIASVPGAWVELSGVSEIQITQ